MALRIGGGMKKPMMDEAMMGDESGMMGGDMMESQEPASEEASESPEEESAEGHTGGTLDQSVAGYKGPEQGPFKCGNCMHYGVSGPGTCEIVSGDIHEDGLCNVFTSKGGGDLLQEEQMPMPEEETPTEEAAPEEEPEGY